MLKRKTATEVQREQAVAVDTTTLEQARAIVDDVRQRGARAVREHGERLGDVQPGAPLIATRADMQAALGRISEAERAVLQRAAGRIETFATAQRSALGDLDTAVPGGWAGHTVRPVRRAGCYAPGGRFPLPSSVLMTAVTARAAGVQEVWVASPRPTDVTLAAAAIANADAVLCVGGAQAIAAFAYGAGDVPATDVVVGPGNRWVTAAKQLVAGHVRIDMLAGPSELLVLADDTADPETIAADLLAQAEHDTDAVPILISVCSESLVDATNEALRIQLNTLPTASTAREALNNGFAVVAANLDEAIVLSDRVAPEHLQVMTGEASAVAARLERYGGLFVGDISAEVFGDYGVGPNHTLPTGGTGRYTGGLSVFDFVAVRTWLRMDADAGPALDAIIDDAAALGRMEGLEAHARAAEKRRR